MPLVVLEVGARAPEEEERQAHHRQLPVVEVDHQGSSETARVRWIHPGSTRRSDTGATPASAGLPLTIGWGTQRMRANSVGQPGYYLLESATLPYDVLSSFCHGLDTTLGITSARRAALKHTAAGSVNATRVRMPEPAGSDRQARSTVWVFDTRICELDPAKILRGCSSSNLC